MNDSGWSGDARDTATESNSWRVERLLLLLLPLLLLLLSTQTPLYHTPRPSLAASSDQQDFLRVVARERETVKGTRKTISKEVTCPAARVSGDPTDVCELSSRHRSLPFNQVDAS